jgi:hypothetical protein
MRQIVAALVVVGTLGGTMAVPVHADNAKLLAPPTRSDFALLDMEPGVGDVSVQAGATAGTATKPKPAPFTLYITMTNRTDLGGTDGFVRVTYNDGDFVDYNIAAGGTVQITLAGGGTPGVDDLITVTGQGGAILIGQISLITEKGKPHPGLAGQDGNSFCTTTAGPGT